MTLVINFEEYEKNIAQIDFHKDHKGDKVVKAITDLLTNLKLSVDGYNSLLDNRNPQLELFSALENLVVVAEHAIDDSAAAVAIRQVMNILTQLKETLQKYKEVTFTGTAPSGLPVKASKEESKSAPKLAAPAAPPTTYVAPIKNPWTSHDRMFNRLASGDHGENKTNLDILRMKTIEYSAEDGRLDRRMTIDDALNGGGFLPHQEQYYAKEYEALKLKEAEIERLQKEIHSIQMKPRG